MSIDLTKLAPAPWYVGEKNDDGWLGPPGEIAIMADVGKDSPVGPKGFVAAQDGRMCVAIACPTPDDEKDLYPELTRLHADFIVLARNALDVMTRRGWYACRTSYEGEPPSECWIVCSRTASGEAPNVMYRYRAETEWSWSNPFTALVEADRWMREMEGNKPS